MKESIQTYFRLGILQWMSYPRQEGRRPSYLVISIEDQGEIKYEIKYL